MSRPKREELPIFSAWMQFLEWLLPTTEKFPKRARFTLANRIDNLAIDVIEDLVEARYTHDKLMTLRVVNRRLERLRVLLRLSYRLHYLSRDAYEHAAKSVNESGRMLGGWIRDLEKSRQ